MTTLVNRKQIQETIAKIRKLGLHGYGGACSAAAARINKVIFKGKGKYAAGVNEYLLEHERIAGHVVVSFAGRFWDSEGIVDPDDLLAWGMVDPDDPDYRNVPGWNPQHAEKSILIEFDNEREMLTACPWNRPIPRK